jgi:hypothetical protein
MSKSKSEPEKKEGKIQPQNPFAGFSRFGKPPQSGNTKFTPKGISNRPTFVTQHKGGGGK